MSNAVATQQPTALATNEQRQQLREFDTRLKQFRADLGNPQLGTMEKFAVQADAIIFIEQSITDQLLDKAMSLMNSPHGFKTDKTKPNEGFYSRDVVKKCLVTALLSGAQLVGNQFNIIAGQCYLTKEFYRPAILRWPGLKNFEIYIGIPAMLGDRASVFEATAKWEIGDEKFEISFRKQENGMDTRLVVKATPSTPNYTGSSPDELRGKAEAKLYNRVWQRLTGLNLGGDDDEGVIEGTVTARAEIVQQEALPVEKPVEQRPVSDTDTAKTIYNDFKSQILLMNGIQEVQGSLRDTVKLIQTAEWSDELKQGTKECIEEAANDRINAIKATRGENSNK